MPEKSSDHDSVRRLKQEARAVEHFVSAMQRHLDEIRVSQRTFTLSDEERKRLWEFNNSGLGKGVAAGLVTMVLLRRMRSSILKRITTARQHQQRPPSAFNNGSPSPFSTGHVQNSPFTTPPPNLSPPPMATSASTNQISSNLMGTLGWVLDAMVSFSVMVTASVYFTDVPGIMQGLAEFPKLPGGSQVADEFCPVVLRELQELQKREMEEEEETQQNTDSSEQYFASESTTSSQDPMQWQGQPVQSLYLKSILQFAENCRQTKHEASSPSSNNDNWDDSSSNWADSMTTDQEDDDK